MKWKVSHPSHSLWHYKQQFKTFLALHQKLHLLAWTFIYRVSFLFQSWFDIECVTLYIWLLCTIHVLELIYSSFHSFNYWIEKIFHLIPMTIFVCWRFIWSLTFRTKKEARRIEKLFFVFIAFFLFIKYISCSLLLAVSLCTSRRSF